ncbi:oligosaccharide flippase family protein [Altererythrobacter fulvus]|uniref:oligosaccharide flippase family protein n=1 Tax=Caenibius fulvus TaxID=2126012 RepID=UPI00301B544A
MRLAPLTSRIPPALRPMIGGFAAYASAEAATRVVRIVTILVIARRTDPALLGTAAAALSLFELIRVLANAGVGQRIVAARADELDRVCNTAQRVFWLICVCVALIQLVAAAALAVITGEREAAAMLAVLSGVYLLMPPGLVQIFLLMREGRMGATARIGATQTMTDHVLTLGLVLIWPSAWAIVLPKLLTAPVWTLLARRARPWAPRPAAGYAHWRVFAVYGPAVLASEMLAAARLQADKLIVGAMLGLDALGLYYFAFNAGLGISQSLITAFGTVLFPSLCRAGGEREREVQLRQAFLLGLPPLVLLVACQGLLAPIYVPILFGPKWVSAAPFLSLLCLAALPLMCGAMLGAKYRADGEPLRETRMAATATVFGLGGLALGASHSIALACIGYSAGLALALCLPALRLAFPGSHIATLKGELS